MTAYRCASFNLKVGSAAHRAAQVAFVARHGREHDIGVWFLQEAIGYKPGLSTLTDYRLHQVDAWPHSDNCAILVRDDIPSWGQWALRQHETWPRPRMSGIHPPRTSLTVLIDDTWRAMSIHGPSIKGASEGKDKRIAAYKAWGDGIVRAVVNSRPGLPWLVAGDWNEAAGEPGAIKSGSICRRAGLTPAVLDRIDFPAFRHGTVSGVVHDRANNGRSDHPLVRFTWEPDGTVEPPAPPSEFVPVSEETLAEMHRLAVALQAQGRDDIADVLWAYRKPAREGLPLS